MPDPACVEERRKADRGDAKTISDGDSDAVSGVVLATCRSTRFITLPRRALGQEKYKEQEQRKDLLRRSKRGQPAWQSDLQSEGEKAPSFMAGMHRFLPVDKHLF